VDADKFLVQTPVVLPGGVLGEKGRRLSRAELAGCDLAWLVQSNALLPLSASVVVSLLPDNPTQDQLIGEVARLQLVIERQGEELDALKIAASAPAPSPVAAGPSSAQLAAELQEANDAANRAVTALTIDRDAARQRADQYAARVTELEGDLARFGVTRGRSPQSQAAPPVPAPPAGR
jgi:hypothetical protein